ncbi:MAG TPA: methionyl-tRNA formyltransferase, partial [Bacilli bacterium]|nr:methionyl-tRNA formyltransferase [Bacilli bacterium]
MEKENLRLVFMGTPRISAYVFESMIEDGYHFVGLIAQPDRPVGRHGELEKVPTKLVAEKYGIPVFQPLKIRKEYEFVKDLEPDLIITLAYGQIVPQGLLDIPKYGCLNLHGSLLPKYRGAAPIQYALINNEKMTGMTLMEMIAEMDAGRMYAKQKVEITPDDNATSLFKKMGLAAKDLILENLPLYVDGQLPGELQNENLITFAPTIKIEQERIDLSQEADQILGWIRALSDRPGAYFILDGAKIKVFRAELVKLPAKGQVGEVIKADKDGLVIQLNGGQLSLLEVQKEGKKRMDYRSFINGNHQ